ncbi:MAG: DUF4159 domain-containing protein [Bacteroides sp.]|nr:DUF4159 domain-containing protein [Bacteroides sp.]
MLAENARKHGKKLLRTLAVCGVLLCFFCGNARSQQVQIGLLKYSGGGDWYANPTSLPNLIAFASRETGMDLDLVPLTVEVGGQALFSCPFVHMTGHGNVVFSEAEVQNLRTYLTGGGFLHIDDNYGMDRFIRAQMKKVFPELDFVELPASHPVFRQAFDYSRTGLPKVHEHDNKRPQAFALFYEGRMVCLYTYECDLGDGWEDPEVHGDTPETHRKALEMGANLLRFVFMQ